MICRTLSVSPEDALTTSSGLGAMLSSSSSSSIVRGLRSLLLRVSIKFS